VRGRPLAGLLALAALLVAGVSFSGAAFTAGSFNPGNAFATSNAFNLTVAMVDPGAYLRGTVTLQATASDGEDGSSISSVTIQRSPAGAGTWANVCTDTTSPYSCSFDTTLVTDGLYDFRATTVNTVGGSATSTTVANRRVDNTSPTAGLTAPPANIRGTITIDASGSDTGSGVASVAIQRSPAGAGTWTTVCTDATSPYSCSFDSTLVADGLYDFRAVATDNAGNTGNSATSANRRVDNTAPTMSMTNPGSPITGSVSFSGTATDSGSGVTSVTFQVSPAGLNTWSDLCSDTTSPYSCSYDTSLLADGTYDYRAVGVDASGNTGSSSVWAGGIVDNTFPSSTMTDPGAYLRGTVTLGATAGDGAGSGIANVVIQRSPAGAGTWTNVCTDTTSPYSCSFNTTLVTDGLYDFRALATDNVSKTTVSTTVTNRRVDNTAPTATMNDPGANLRGTVSLTAAGTDGGSGVANIVIQRSPAGAGTWTTVCTDTTSPYSCSFNTTLVTDGLYDFRAITTDNAGNTTTSTTVANRRVDNTAPTAGLTDPGSPLRLTVTLNATGTDVGGSGVANVKIQRSPAGAGTWTDICTDTTSPYSCSWNTTGVSDGLYDLRSVATDNAGNATNSTVVANRIVDNTAPTGTNIQTTNVGGGTAGMAQAGDTIVFTFSEQIAPGTIVSGWNGTGTQTITVTGSNSNQITIAGATITSSFITLAAGTYFQSGKTIVFANSTIAQSANTVTITLGAPDKPQWVNTVGTAGQMGWPVATTLTDMAGNTITSGTVLEVQPPNDVEF
jgi:chitinase